MFHVHVVGDVVHAKQHTKYPEYLTIHRASACLLLLLLLLLLL